jgi:hypothetical protein
VQWPSLVSGCCTVKSRVDDSSLLLLLLCRGSNIFHLAPRPLAMLPLSLGIDYTLTALRLFTHLPLAERVASSIERHQRFAWRVKAPAQVQVFRERGPRWACSEGIPQICRTRLMRDRECDTRGTIEMVELAA